MKKVLVFLFTLVLFISSTLNVFAMSPLPPVVDHQPIYEILNLNGGNISIESVNIMYDLLSQKPRVTYDYVLKNNIENEEKLNIALLLNRQHELRNLQINENDKPKEYNVEMAYFFNEFYFESLSDKLNYHKYYEHKNINSDDIVYVYEFNLPEAPEEPIKVNYDANKSVIIMENQSLMMGFPFPNEEYFPKVDTEEVLPASNEILKPDHLNIENNQSYFIELQPYADTESTVTFDSTKQITKKKMTIDEFLIDYPYQKYYMNTTEDYKLSKDAFVRYKLQQFDSSYDYYVEEHVEAPLAWTYQGSHLTSSGIPNDVLYFADIDINLKPNETKTLSISYDLNLGYDISDPEKFYDVITYVPKNLETFNSVGNINFSIKTDGDVYADFASFEKDGINNLYTATIPFNKDIICNIKLEQEKTDNFEK